MAHAQANPADAGGEALKLNPLSRHVQPVVQMFVLGQDFFHFGVGFVDIFGIA